LVKGGFGYFFGERFEGVFWCASERLKRMKKKDPMPERWNRKKY